MTRDEIIRMAKKSGFPIDRDGIPFVEHDDGECWKELQRFATLVAAAEREAILRHAQPAHDVDGHCEIVAANDIRARGEK